METEMAWRQGILLTKCVWYIGIEEWNAKWELEWLGMCHIDWILHNALIAEGHMTIRLFFYVVVVLADTRLEQLILIRVEVRVVLSSLRMCFLYLYPCKHDFIFSEIMLMSVK